MSGEVIIFKYHYDKNVPGDLKESGVTVKPGEQIVLSEIINVDGFLRSVYLYIPETAKNLVLVRLKVNNVQVFPRDGYFRGSFSGFIPLYIPVSKGDVLYLEVKNYDNQEHFINVVAIIYPAIQTQL